MSRSLETYQMITRTQVYSLQVRVHVDITRRDKKVASAALYSCKRAKGIIDYSILKEKYRLHKQVQARF